MPTFLGTATASSGLPGHQPKVEVTVLSRTASQAVVRYRVGSNPINYQSTTGTFSGTLKVNNSSYAVSAHVPSSGGWFWSRDITYKTSSAFTLNISLTGGIPSSIGWASTSLSGSTSVAAGTAKPGTPTNLTFTRNDASTVTLSWTKGTGATTTRIRMQTNGGAWSSLDNISGSTREIANLGSNNERRFNIRSVNAAGESGVVYSPFFYTKPLTPTTPTLDGAQVKWSLPSTFKTVVEVARSDDNGATTASTVTLGQGVTSWTDPTAQLPLTRYRVRVHAGPANEDPSQDEGAWSDWTGWSESSMAESYRPPQVTKLSARRCDSAGNFTETGKYVKVTFSGTVSNVPDGGTETNWLTRKIGYRKHGTSAAWTETVITNQGAPNPWTDTAVIVGGNSLTETDAWDIRVTLQDNYAGAVIQQVTVPVSIVAFSIGTSGIGAGKAWEKGALDVAGDIYVDGQPLNMDPTYLTVDGVEYATSGSIIVTTAVTTSVGSWYRSGSLLGTFRMPYTPPEGYVFEWGSVLSGVVEPIVAVSGTSPAAEGAMATDEPSLYISGPASRPSRDYRVFWRLTQF